MTFVLCPKENQKLEVNVCRKPGRCPLGNPDLCDAYIKRLIKEQIEEEEKQLNGYYKDAEQATKKKTKKGGKEND